MANQIPTASFRLPESYVAALKAVGQQGDRRGATQALLEILDGNAETVAAFRSALEHDAAQDAAAAGQQPERVAS